MKFHIIGFEKSGTTSLAYYLRSMGHETARHEWLYCFREGPQIHKEYWPDYQPVLIVRSPVYRVFSAC